MSQGEGVPLVTDVDEEDISLSIFQVQKGATCVTKRDTDKENVLKWSVSGFGGRDTSSTSVLKHQSKEKAKGGRVRDRKEDLTFTCKKTRRPPAQAEVIRGRKEAGQGAMRSEIATGDRVHGGHLKI